MADPPSGKKIASRVFVVIMIDYFTKVAEWVPVENKQPITVARAFYDHWICRYGAPSVITTDNGGEFKADFTHMVSRLGIYHVYTSANHPSANGVAERLVRSVKTMLTTHFNEHPADWMSALPMMRLAYMCRPHSSLNGLAPCEMLFGFRPKLPLAVSDVLINSFCAAIPFTDGEYFHQLQHKLNLLREDAVLALDQNMHNNIMAKMKKGDKKPNRDIKEGDLVLEITPVSGPLKTNLKGPFLVVRLNHSQNIALLKTGHTQHRVARYFKRSHISSRQVP
jgi:hypothetical protein